MDAQQRGFLEEALQQQAALHASSTQVRGSKAWWAAAGVEQQHQGLQVACACILAGCSAPNLPLHEARVSVRPEAGGGGHTTAHPTVAMAGRLN